MAKFILRRLGLLLLTMLLVSIAVFLITEAAPGNVARNVLGAFITPEQEESFLAQNGLDKPIYGRYLYWLVGNDWLARRQIGMPVRQIKTDKGYIEWWAIEEDGTLIRWELKGDDLIALRRQPDGSVEDSIDNERWRITDPAREFERLQTYRVDLLANPQLSENDRQEILKLLDHILEILGREAQTQEELTTALAEPESALEALMDPAAVEKNEAFKEAATNLAQDEMLRVIAIFQELSTPEALELKQSDLTKMAGPLGRAADKLEKANPMLAQPLRQASASLKSGDVAGAREKLESVVSALGELTGSLADFVAALKKGDYQQAVTVLRNLSDPAQTPLDAARLAVLPDQLKAVGKALKDVSKEFRDELNQASTSLKEGNTSTAREAIGQAADILEEVGQTVARTEAAKKARVIRQFWGVDLENHAVKWEKGSGKTVYVLVAGGWQEATGGPSEYIPLQRGLLRGDPGLSLQTGRPVADTIFRRLRNSLVLAGLAFVVVMPLALMLGLIAGLNEGQAIDRILSIGGLMFTVTPEFATGIFLILILASWLKLLPGSVVLTGGKAPWERPDMLVLPVLTLTLIELGYVLRITRASMVEVMRAPYIRTAFLKGLPYWRIVFRHAVRNALMAPITVIMLHVNWLLGGIVIVEVIFSYPGLGTYLLDSALYGDTNAIEGGAMIMVVVAVGTQLIADILYTFLNPRIRYA